MALLNTPTLLLCLVAGIGIGGGMIYTHTGPGLLPGAPPNTAAYRNLVRQKEVTQLAGAIRAYRNEHQGSFPVALSRTPTEICMSGGTNCSSAHLIDVSFLAGQYIPTIPRDAAEQSAYGSGYTLMQNSNGQIQIRAIYAEQNQTIQSTL